MTLMPSNPLVWGCSSFLQLLYPNINLTISYALCYCTIASKQLFIGIKLATINSYSMLHFHLIGITCCDEPEINLTVTCTVGIAQLQWEASKYLSFGFMIAFECNTNPICNYIESQVMMCLTL